MRIRYKRDAGGNHVPVAHIFTSNEHNIEPKRIDLDALWVVKKLKQSRHEAYIVGGAVRDLLLGRTPKDFDISTSATPRQVHKIFWNARIIGRRFRLVHLTFSDKIIEVSTFRSGDDEEGGSIYGTVDQDAKRRDFTINSLYYDPTDGSLLDFNNGLEDIKRRRIVSVIPLPDSFIEDPVRMIRAIKYSVSTTFAIAYKTRRSIKKNYQHLARVSTSRLTEEVSKILASGYASAIIQELQAYKLLVYVLPCISVSKDIHKVYSSLDQLDTLINEAKQSGEESVEQLKAEMIKALVAPFIEKPDSFEQIEELFKETYLTVKNLINPLTPPNYDVEMATTLLLKSWNLEIPPHCIKSRKPIRLPNAIGFKTKSQKRETQRTKKGQQAGRSSHKRRKRTKGKANPTPQSQDSP